MDGPAVDREPAPVSRRRFAPSLELNALALMAATGITALVGLGFWAVAARLPASEVGRASAVLSTATMLSLLASSNIGLLFSRVLASAGGKSRSVVLAGYGAATGIGAILGVGFVLFIPNDALFDSWLDRATFPLLVVLFCIFVLQDWVLIGLRAARWVPLEQLLFALAKLGLLVLFSALVLDGGIVLAWAIPCALAVLIINVLLLGRVLPNRPPPASGAAEMPSRRGLGIIFLAEYATGAMAVVIPLTLPLIVVAQLGTEANAYYALPWLIAESLGLLIWNISSSYMVEASHDGPQIAALMRRTFRLSLLVGGLGVPFLLIAAPLLLSFLGPDYAAEGTTVLRLMVAAIPFTIIVLMYVTTSRVKNQMGRVVAIQLLSAIMVIGLALALIPRLGIDGAGWAYLIAEAIAAAIVIVPLIRFMRANQVSLLRKPPPVTEPVPVPASTNIARAAADAVTERT